MPGLIDMPQPPRRHRLLFLVLAILAVALFSSRTALSYYVDALWFGSLGYEDVFRKTLSLQWTVFAAFSAATFLFLYGWFLALRRALPARLAGQSHDLHRRAAVESFRSSASCASSDSVVALVIAARDRRRHDGGVADLRALLVRAAHAAVALSIRFSASRCNFYLFTLPAWQFITGWLMTLAVIACVVAVFFILITGGTRALAGRRAQLHPIALARDLRLRLRFFLLILAMRVYIGRFERLFDDHTIFRRSHLHRRARHADWHAGRLCRACPGRGDCSRQRRVGAAVAGWSRRSLPAAVCYLALQVFGWYVNSFIVKPNELVRERPYIAHNIELTRQAYGLEPLAQREFPAETTVEAADPANNQATLQNIRLWDWRALQDTLRQIQEIRTYYDFPDIDIDRYEIDGTIRQVMLATRELSVEKLPESSRNWINEKLIYTHGYGITMNPVNGFTPEGLPTLILSNMPVQSTVKSINVTRPEIYFGELTNTDVYVKTRQKEFNYPQGQTNSLTSYEGNGGIVLGGFLRRIIIALDRGDLAKLPFSDDVNGQSRLLMRRNVRDRVSALAPFLTYDSDPYIVVGDDGRLSWIMDAFTTSDSYPYSSHYPLGSNRINYMRNSVKVVIDAYDGTTTFYVFDPDDPILAAYRRIFPSLFKDASAMPPALRKHVRYPELLLKLQAAVYGLYHMTDPEVFYNREDLWTVASEVGHGRVRRADDAGDGAEFRADETAGRNRTWSSSRFCRSRQPTGTI